MYLIERTKIYHKWASELKDIKAKSLINERVYRVGDGLFGDIAPVGDGVSELRIHYGPGYRVYFSKKADKIILLLCGGSKSSQDRDITVAKKLLKQWENNNGIKNLSL